jgi:hypothetical protein
LDEACGCVGGAAGLAGGVGSEQFCAAAVGGAGFGPRDEALQDLRIFLIRKKLLPRGRQARRSPPDNGDRLRREARVRRLPRASFGQPAFDLRQDRAQRRDGGVVKAAVLLGLERCRGSGREGFGEARDDLFGGV